MKQNLILKLFPNIDVRPWRLYATQCSCMCSVYRHPDGRCIVYRGMYVVQHQECLWTEHSHLFGWHGVVVLRSVLTIKSFPNIIVFLQ
jgi:hypothetical protein